MGYTEDIFSALDIQDDLQTLYTSGTVFHAFLGEKLPDWKAAADLVRKIAENYKLPYYTMSPTYSVCSEHGYLTGEQFTCPHCGKPAEVYSRITGYYRPVQNWNDGKTQEYKDRKVYDIKTSYASIAKHTNIHEDPIPVGEPAEEKSEADQASAKATLFATPTCPNCKLACALMDKAGFPYEKLMAEEHPELVAKYGIKQAPTLVIEDGEHVIKLKGVSEIKKFVTESVKAAV